MAEYMTLYIVCGLALASLVTAFTSEEVTVPHYLSMVVLWPMGFVVILLKGIIEIWRS